MNLNPTLRSFYEKKQQNRKSVAVLLDPDKVDFATLSDTVKRCEACRVAYFFVGGSLIYSDKLTQLVRFLKAHSTIPVILFPGNSKHICPEADAILFLTLVSGRNPEYLIGQHIVAAPELKRSKLDILSTAYMLIDGGKPTTVSYVSNTTPIPANKPDIAAVTALAAEMMGMHLAYLDAGSGAESAVSTAMIERVRATVAMPLIVGGGIRSGKQIRQAFQSGADVVVIGNAIEENPDFILELTNITENILIEPAV